MPMQRHKHLKKSSPLRSGPEQGRQQECGQEIKVDLTRAMADVKEHCQGANRVEKEAARVSRSQRPCVCVVQTSPTRLSDLFLSQEHTEMG